MPIDESDFMWISVKELSRISYDGKNFGRGTTHFEYFSLAGLTREVEVLRILFRKGYLFDTVFFRRWLLPPQALNAYYLPNKNQMGECTTIHCTY